MSSLENKWIEWLANRWASDFNFSYENSKKRFSISCIRQAYEKYEWHGDFKQTEELLDRFATDLQTAIQEGDNDQAYKTCIKVLKWGGVASNTKKGKRPTVEWLDTNRANDELCSKISLGLDALRRHNTDAFDGKNLLMDSASTKIFSVADKDKQIVIYDGRVGAALCYSARKFLEENNIKNVVPPFDYTWGGARTKSVNRDPSYLGFKFQRLWSGLNRNQDHAAMVVRATELIKKLSKITKVESRKWEAAFFMIGYKIPID
jgi:hypothetical protein